MAADTPDSRSTVQASRGPSKEEQEKPFNDIDITEPTTQPTPVDENDYPSSFKLVSVIVALVLAVFLASLDMNIIATAIPRITDEFHSLDDVSPVLCIISPLEALRK